LGIEMRKKLVGEIPAQARDQEVRGLLAECKALDHWRKKNVQESLHCD